MLWKGNCDIFLVLISLGFNIHLVFGSIQAAVLLLQICLHAANLLHSCVKPRGVVELTYKIFNFTEDQDVRLKIGYNPFEKSTSAMEEECRGDSIVLLPWFPFVAFASSEFNAFIKWDLGRAARIHHPVMSFNKLENIVLLVNSGQKHRKLMFAQIWNSKKHTGQKGLLGVIHPRIKGARFPIRNPFLQYGLCVLQAICQAFQDCLLWLFCSIGSRTNSETRKEIWLIFQCPVHYCFTTFSVTFSNSIMAPNLSSVFH
eukprot:Gb_25560 [translate_table: standard]